MIFQCLKTLCSIKRYAKQEDDGVEAELHTSLTTALDGGECGKLHALVILTCNKEPWYPLNKHLLNYLLIKNTFLQT
jgi:hypothetical protein